MHREIIKWYSTQLEKEMEVVKYGHYGFALLMFPTAGADFLEYERFELTDDIASIVDGGKCKVYSINSINKESWLNDDVPNWQKSFRHYQYNQYVVDEVVPFIHNDCNGRVPIITCGASLGALHSANMFFKHPDIFDGVIAMSGVYSLSAYSKGYYDDHCYYNSPSDFLPGLCDETILEQLRTNKKIIIATGQGEYEDPSASVRLSEILMEKNIPHDLQLWGHDMRHDWPTWRKMLPNFLESKF
ncbi:MAG: esterase [Ignavibacteria bacterium]|nr:esterase [Ignavibacteria bacterium]